MTHDHQGILAGLPAGTAGHVDHIGIAVPDLEQALLLYRDLLGLELERIEEVPQENVRVAFLKLDRQGGPGHLELLAPMSEAGAIAAFIAKRGPGLHHVAVAAAQGQDMTVIALTGRTGGALRGALGETDVLVAVPPTDPSSPITCQGSSASRISTSTPRALKSPRRGNRNSRCGANHCAFIG